MRHNEKFDPDKYDIFHIPMVCLVRISIYSPKAPLQVNTIFTISHRFRERNLIRKMLCRATWGNYWTRVNVYTDLPLQCLVFNEKCCGKSINVLFQGRTFAGTVDIASSLEKASGLLQLNHKCVIHHPYILCFLFPSFFPFNRKS